MSVKIRLSRHGKKHNAYYHIVVADARAPRDGKFIEVIGNYNPNTNPATINLNSDKALAWLGNGAQPTDTCRAILSYKGVLFRNHLQKGVTKGVLTQEAADAKLAAWEEGKVNKIEEKKVNLSSSAKKSVEDRLVEEKKKKEAKAEAIRIKNTPPPVEEAASVAEESAPEAPAAEGEAPAEA
ncbi:MAG: 30S ribosomal protein S16 [Bacteroidetes bacterium]|nr:30S ribosomal protein S16 [Bacteroidota bacterium]